MHRTLFYMDVLIAADIGGIFLAVSTGLLEGAAEGGAVGVLGVALLVMLWKYPTMVERIVQPHVEANDRLVREIKNAIDGQTKQIAKLVENRRQEQN